MDAAPANRQTKNKLATALSPEQLGALFVRLSGEANLTIVRIKQIALDEYGISIGLDSANEFRDKEFGAWCEKLNKRSQLIRALNANSDGNEASTIARQADAELQQLVFEAIMSADELDVTSKEGIETANALSKIISRARLSDDRFAKVSAELEALKAKLTKMESETKADLTNTTLSLEEREARMLERFGVTR